MPQPISLRELVSRGVELEPHEAVAIAQELIACVLLAQPLREPLGPPSLDTVQITPDGSVECHSSASEPAVFEIAILLDAMLPRAGVKKIPGGLRYTIARALMEVEAPPFESIAELSAVLQRYERGDRREALRGVYDRAGDGDARLAEAAVAQRRQAPYELKPGAASEVSSPVDRRQRGPRVDTLRRELREADESLFYLLQVQSAPDFIIREPLNEPIDEPSTPLAPSRWRSLARPLVAAAALLISMAGGYGAVHYLRLPAETPPAVAPSTVTAIIPPVRTIAPEAAPSPAPPTRRVPASIDRGVRPPVVPHVQQAVRGGDFGLRDIEVMTIADTRSRSYNVQPSPDGARIAFDSDRDGQRGVYLADRDGTSVRRVSGNGFAAVPAWSPDSRTVAFLRAEPDRSHVLNLWLLDATSGDLRRLTSFRKGETTGAAWFPDGHRIAFAHDDRIVVQDAATGANREFPPPANGARMRGLAVSPDGHQMIFQTTSRGVWLLDLRDSSSRCVLTDPTAESFKWSADGRRVAYYSRRDKGWGVWIRGPES